MCKITEKHLAAHWPDCAVIIKQKIFVKSQKMLFLLSTNLEKTDISIVDSEKTVV